MIIKQKQLGMLGPDLGIYCSGLFPFFQYASIGNKSLFLNLIKKQFLEINDQELQLVLPGLLVSILPGLDDSNEQTHRLIKEIFKGIRVKVGEKNFFGVFWAVVLRTVRVRLSGLKYLVEGIPQYKPMEEEALKEYISSFYPNVSILVINSLSALIEDENTFVQRFAMDFLIHHFPINNKILKKEEMITLLKSSMFLLVKNEYSTTRRLFSWLLLGEMNEEEGASDNPDFKIVSELIVESLKLIFNMGKQTTREGIISGIKIVDSLLKHQVCLVDITLDNISINMVNSVKEYILNQKLTFSDDLVLKIQKFFKDFDNTYLNCLWSSLDRLLAGTLLKCDKPHEVASLLSFCLNYISV